jgi:hypothetical protein
MTTKRQPWEQLWRDYYQALGVPFSASLEEIRHAFRVKAQFVHPDHLRGMTHEVQKKAEEEFRLLNEALEVLQQPASRSAYDLEYGRRIGKQGTATYASSAKPLLEIAPADLMKAGVDTRGGIVTFSVLVRQVGGPTFDPSIHRLQIAVERPWDIEMFSRIQTSNDRPPMTIEFDLDPSRLEDGQEYSGLVHVDVRTIL